MMITQTLRQDFTLSMSDTEHLDSRGLPWESIIDKNNRWVVLHYFPVPSGYTVDKVDIALLLPASYPTAQIDMVYVNPDLLRNDGRVIRQTDSKMDIAGISYQRWSRHRTAANPWRPDFDDISTHLSLVEEWFIKDGR